MSRFHPGREVVVVGVGLHPFGRFPKEDLATLARSAVVEALKDGGVGWTDIPVAYFGHVYYHGMSVGETALAALGLTGIPIINVENACSSGSTAFWQAYWGISSGMFDLALAFGAEKVPSGPEAVETGKVREDVGSWLVEGIGEDFIPPVCDLSLVSRHRRFENVLQHVPAFIQPQFVQQKRHQIAMTEITDRLVVQLAHIPRERFTERSQSARCVERFIIHPVERKMLQPLQWQQFRQRSVVNRLTRIAVLVDQAVRRPCQVVFERADRILRQRTDSHADAVPVTRHTPARF